MNRYRYGDELMTKELPIEINVAELKKLRDDKTKHTVLDVREPREIEICSLANSLNIPMKEVSIRIGSLPTEGSLIVMCHSGQRSMQITKWLRTNGLKHAQNLSGGIDAWAIAFDSEMKRY